LTLVAARKMSTARTPSTSTAASHQPAGFTTPQTKARRIASPRHTRTPLLALWCRVHSAQAGDDVVEVVGDGLLELLVGA
jgi:hypothetical protein